MDFNCSPENQRCFKQFLNDLRKNKMVYEGDLEFTPTPEQELILARGERDSLAIELRTLQRRVKKLLDANVRDLERINALLVRNGHHGYDLMYQENKELLDELNQLPEI